MKLRYLLFVVAGCLFSAWLHSQVIIERAEGQWELSRDITPVQAEQRALLEAKREALRLAGVPEKVNTASLHIQMADSLYFNNFFAEISMLQISGLVKVLQQEISDFYDPQTSRMIKKAVIRAEVVNTAVPSSMHPFTLSGLNNTYRKETSVRFSLTPGMSCYFHIFIFDSVGGSLLYPNRYEENQQFTAGQTYQFPLNRLIEYAVYKETINTTYEQNILLVVATKEQFAFREEVTIDKVFEWLYRIPADQRYEELFSFLVE